MFLSENWEIYQKLKIRSCYFDKINSRIETLTLGNYLFMIQLLKTQLSKKN
jgi:prephenate dehydratase